MHITTLSKKIQLYWFKIKIDNDDFIKIKVIRR